jgi:hypothetical protein
VVSCILFYGSIVYSIFVVIVFLDLFRFITICIITLSLAKEGKNFLFFFCEIVSREEKEGDAL